MKQIRWILLCLFAAALLLCLAGCGGDQTLEERGYTVTVSYDYNGGTSDNLPGIKMLYRQDQPLLAPGSSAEFKEPTLDRYHTLAGWYRALTDAEGNIEKDENGQPRTEDAPFAFAGARASENLTLVAKWKTKPTVEIHVDGFETVSEPFNVGASVTETMLAGLLPDVRGKTFYGYYADEACTQPVTLPLSMQDGEIRTLYTRYLDGDVLIVRTKSDLTKLSQYAYRTVWLDADIDMTGARFPSLTAFGGQLIGNGHTIRNLTVSTTLTGRTTGYGLFGQLRDGARISDLTFENVQVTVDASYSGQTLFKAAFLASTASGEVTLDNVTFADCTLTVKLPENAMNDLTTGETWSVIIGSADADASVTGEIHGAVSQNNGTI